MGIDSNYRGLFSKGRRKLNKDLDYIEEIDNFAKEKLEEIFRKQENEEYKPDMIDGITTCCGYDFGTDAKRGKYCPICGKRLVVVK